MNEFEAQKLKGAVKQQLKRKNVKYSDLAEHLTCSIPTVKRILGEEELTLSRLLQILQFLDLTLTELEMLATAQNKPAKDRFTPGQEEFLAKNPNHFAYLNAIYQGLTPAAIAVKHKLTQRSTDKYLIALERAELIHVTGRQKVKPAYKSFPELKDGLLARTYFQNFMRVASDFFIKDLGDHIYAQVKPQNQLSKHFSLQDTKLTLPSYKRLVEDIQKILREVDTTSSYEEKAFPESELKTAVFMSGITYVDNDNSNLVMFESVFGTITNL